MRTPYVLLFLHLLACNREKADSSTELYRACDVAEDCTDQPDDHSAECLDKGGEGFCTWSCTSDADCALDDGDPWTMVCASFESSEGTWCFPACQNDDAVDEDEICPGNLGCRSTGGGTDNQRVCFPSEGGSSP